MKTDEQIKAILLQNPGIQAVETANIKDFRGNIYATSTIHTYDGTLLNEVMDSISDAFENGTYEESSEINHDPKNFISTNFVNDECSVSIYTSIKKLPAPTESPKEIFQPNITTEWTAEQIIRQEG